MSFVTDIATRLRQNPSSQPRFWVYRETLWHMLALLTISVITIAAVFWILDHPYGTNWDEARYINQAYRDVAAFQRGGLGELLRVLVAEDRSRPPAFRLFVLPFTLGFGASPTLVRLVSLGSLWVTLGFVYLAAQRVAGAVAGAFAAIFLVLCPIIVQPSMRFYVDYPLYIVIAALFYFLFVNSSDRGDRDYPSWVGLGITLGIGGLAKPTVALIAAPVMLLAFGWWWRQPQTRAAAWSLFQSTGLAIALMLPWWIFNVKPAVGKAFLSGGYIRHALGPERSVATVAQWFYVFVQSMLGPALAVLSVAIVGAFALRFLRHRYAENNLQAIALCLAGSLPLLLMAALGTNHNPRLTAVALVPLAIALGIMATSSHWLRSRPLAAITIVLLSFQLMVMVSPSAGDVRYQAGDRAADKLLWGNPTVVMQREEQWDWSLLKEICDRHEIAEPSIAYLGNGGNLSPDQIRYPWVTTGTSAEVHTLWLYELGEINWEQIFAALQTHNVVVTAFDVTTNIADRQDLDNQHNAEFVERLQASGQFSEPFELKLGRYHPSQVLVFLRQPQSAT